MGKDLDIAILEKKIEKAKTQEDKVPFLTELKKLDPGSKLLAAHKKGGKFYSGDVATTPPTANTSLKSTKRPAGLQRMTSGVTGAKGSEVR